MPTTRSPAHTCRFLAVQALVLGCPGIHMLLDIIQLGREARCVAVGEQYIVLFNKATDLCRDLGAFLAVTLLLLGARCATQQKRQQQHNTGR
jgi:hypothetical protein